MHEVRRTQRTGLGAAILVALLGLVGPVGLGSWVSCASATRWPTASEEPFDTGKLEGRSLPGSPSIDYFAYVPKRGGVGAPLLLCVHGISRNAAVHGHAFATLAEQYGVVLAVPLFAAPPFTDYQRLGRRKEGARADLALRRLVKDVGYHTGALSDRVHLFGHSGGAQFVHRFAMAWPGEVAAAVVSSAGWYTLPDASAPYPYGLRVGDELPGVRFDPAAFLRLRWLAVVGERDLMRSDALRRTRRVDTEQGRTRVERARIWTHAMNRAASKHGLPPPVSLVEIPGVGHSFEDHLNRGGLAERVFEFLFPRR